MRNLTELARATYGRHLDRDERIVIAANAMAGGIRQTIATALVIGSLVGALYAVNVDNAALLAVMTLGAFGGIIGGYVVAEIRAHRSAGPGSVLVQLVMTDTRLLLLRRQPALRFRPLRVYRLNEIARITSVPSRVGMYQLVKLHLHDAPDVELHVEGGHDFTELHHRHRGA